MKRKLLFLLPAVLGLALVAGYLARRPKVKAPGIPPNILLITIDTIRPDRLTPYGGKNPTPNLDRIASEGLLFESAFSQVPLTFPSHTSILTGMFPVHHGMHQNGLQIFTRPEWTLSRALHSNGYKTGAVVSAFVLDRKFGLAPDFDVYEDRMERSPGIASNFDVERKGQETTDAALRIIEGFAGTRWFVWVHYYDPHTPYDPPKPLNGYDGEVQYVDQQIGRLRSRLEEAGLDKNLAIAVVGDHGESLGEHGEETHGFFIYNSTVKVPLILTYPGVSPKRVTAPAATVDITPTLLQLAGIQDIVQRDGESLLELAQSEKRRAPFVLESRYPELFGWNRLEGLLDGRWKLIATTRSELYAWQEDPSETANLFAREEAASRKLKQQLSSYESIEPADSGQPDPETLEKLKSLGYISTTSVAKTRGTADPKDKIQVWAEYERSLQLKTAGKNEEALQVLQTLVGKEPDNPFLRTAVASELRAAGRPEDAIPELQAAIQADPAGASTYQELALAYRDIRNYPEAVRAIQAAVTLQPDRSELHSVLGLLQIDTGRFAEAEQEFQQVLKIDPNNAVAWNNLGNALRALNRGEEAAAAYKKSIDLSPKYAYPLNGLATILIQQHRTAEAIPLMEKALELDPKFVEVYLNLGIAFHSIGEKDKAATLYKSFLKLAPAWMEKDRENAQILLRQIAVS